MEPSEMFNQGYTVWWGPTIVGLTQYSWFIHDIGWAEELSAAQYD